MQIHFDGAIQSSTYRRGFVRHYQPSTRETVFRLVGMLAVVGEILVMAMLGVTEAVFYVMCMVVGLLLALPWFWPSLLAGVAWRRRALEDLHEKGFVTATSLVYEREGVEQSVVLRDLLKARVFDDMLLLYYHAQSFTILSRDLLAQPGQWDVLVAQVLDVVPNHDTMKRKRWPVLAVGYAALIALLGYVIWRAAGL